MHSSMLLEPDPKVSPQWVVSEVVLPVSSLMCILTCGELNGMKTGNAKKPTFCWRKLMKHSGCMCPCTSSPPTRFHQNPMNYTFAAQHNWVFESVNLAKGVRTIRVYTSLAELTDSNTFLHLERPILCK